MNIGRYIIYLVCFILGIVITIISFRFVPQKAAEVRTQAHYQFINPLLECDTTGISTNNGINSLENSLEKYIQNQKQVNKANHISVYFRDLKNGPVMAIDEQVHFSPASLLKLPLLMTYLKFSESDLNLLNRPIMITKDDLKQASQIIQYDTAGSVLNAGSEYTVGELLKTLIVYSDNVALHVLAQRLDTERYNKIYKDLDLPSPQDAGEDFLSVKQYATFYRILYNSSYLSEDHSEQALHLLSQTAFDKGITQGIPKSVTVSHKFGERGLPDGQKQLHDCGIVYLPDQPYLLCIMTRGDSFEELSEIIGEISRKTYEHMKKNTN